MLTRVSLDPDRHQKLPDVSLCVFGGVKQKTEDRGRKGPATYKSRLRQNRFIDGPKLIHGQLHLTMECRCQIPGGLGGISGGFLASQVLQLGDGKRFTPCIGEQSIQYPDEVLKMKSDRSDSAGARP